MRVLLQWYRWKLDCTDPLPAVTLNLQTFQQALAFALLGLPVFTFGGLVAWGRDRGQGSGVRDQEIPSNPQSSVLSPQSFS